ncbi:hypothetical protein BRC87_12275 [Halobacteriales archaeon QS_4_66_20]|nr:MAG: hypothetical protein BRC87_12275 [Halobacteriales archaeon QS_4_66_20]
MTEFRTEGVLDIVLDQQSLKDARSTVEKEIGDVTVSVESDDIATGGGVTNVTDGGMSARGSTTSVTGLNSTLSRQTGVMESMVALGEERNELLAETVDLLDDEFASGGVLSIGGGPGGPGSGPSPGDDTDIMEGAIGGGAARGLPSAAKIAAGVTAPVIGAVAGAAGTRLLQEIGVTDVIEGAGEDTGNVLDATPNILDSDTLSGILSRSIGVQQGAGILDLALPPFLQMGDRENQKQLENIRKQTAPSGDGNDGFGDTLLDVFTSSYSGITLDPGGGDSGSSDPTTAQDPPYFMPGGSGEDPPFFRPPGPTAVTGAGNTQITTPISQRDDLLGATARARPGERYFGAGADRSTPGGTATAGRTRPPASASGGAGDVQQSTEVTVQADIQIETSTDDLQRELSRELDQLEQRIMRAIPEQSDSISREMQQSFQRKI